MLKEWSETSSFGQQHPQTRAALARLEHLDLGRSFDAAARTFVAGVTARFSRQDPRGASSHFALSGSMNAACVGRLAATFMVAVWQLAYRG